MQNHSSSTAEQRPLVLYVDDEALARKYFAKMIEEFADVVTAGTTAEARGVLAEKGDRIALCVSDERMPGESGVPFLAEMREKYPHVCRILTSAYADIENLQRAINHAAVFRFIPKPWNHEQLTEVIREALKKQAECSSSAEVSAGPAPEAFDALEQVEAALKALEESASQLMSHSMPKG